MFNLQPFEGKTIRNIQKRQGGEQVIIYFEDESFLIVTAQGRTQVPANLYRASADLTFAGRAMVSK